MSSILPVVVGLIVLAACAAWVVLVGRRGLRGGTEAAAIPTPRYQLAVVEVNGRIYAIGGGTREIMNELISKAEGY